MYVNTALEIVSVVPPAAANALELVAIKFVCSPANVVPSSCFGVKVNVVPVPSPVNSRLAECIFL